MGAAGQSDAAYTIDESCRFNDDDSAYTGAASPTPTSERIFTFSFWVKRGNLGINSNIWTNERDDGAGTMGQIAFQTNDTIRWKSESTAGANLFDRQTNAVFRDPSAWYHIVCICDSNQTDNTAADIYVNGVVQTYSTTTNPGSGQDLGWPSTAQPFEVGRKYNGTYYLDAYLAHFYFIDGQKLTPSSFGETNSTTGQWVPKEYSGTFGNAGLFLDFSVAPGTGAGAGTDSSGNDNDLTDSGLAAADQRTDTPTSNRATLNPVSSGGTHTLSDGNLVLTSSGTTGYWNRTHATQAATQKMYWEVVITTYYNIGAGLSRSDNSVSGENAPGGAFGAVVVNDETNVVGSVASESSGAITFPIANGDVVNVAFDPARGALWYGLDGTWKDGTGSSASSADILTEIQGTGTTSAIFTGFSTSQTWIPCISTYGANAGVARFSEADQATALPTGYIALDPSETDDPTIADPTAYSQPTIYTGNGTAIGSGGLAVNQGGNSTFQPDLVWIKNRDAADSHRLFDLVDGVTKYMQSDQTAAAQQTNTETLTSFDSDGFTVGNEVGVNTNTEKYVAWQWLAGNTSGSSNTAGSITSTVDANTTSGFSIIKFTGTEANATVGHGLSAAPEFIIGFNLSVGRLSPVQHVSTGYTKYLYINDTYAAFSDADMWNSAPTSSLIGLGSHSNSNGPSEAEVLYAWHSVDGFSKFGSYEGNGNADGTFVYTGMKPALIICKSIDSTSDWFMFDNQRLGYNVDNNSIFANTNAAELTADNIDILSNGFKMRISTDPNVAETYIYMAWAETPFKTAIAR